MITGTFSVEPKQNMSHAPRPHEPRARSVLPVALVIPKMNNNNNNNSLGLDVQ